MSRVAARLVIAKHRPPLEVCSTHVTLITGLMKISLLIFST